ncbi:MAG: mechanosensitive ion channel [Nanoarchaeota archaeon]|nr:mechanosensitive ion channel [Nanoarchaeota archaeon]MBU4242460.1 mechanosensitive ion channel [Nanoarchaeota archaeon]MBU4352433.1 mechanosensitive ion channel [Nanoarchaeota archaeon]
MNLLNIVSLDTLGMQNVSNFMVKLIAALAILLFGIIIANISAKLFKKLLHSFEINSVLAGVGFKFPLEEFASSILKYVIYFATVIWALTELGLATTILQIILIVILIIMIVFIILAFKDIIPNITAGFMMHSKGLYQKGDKISVGTAEGKIVDLDIMETKIQTKEGDIILIPNSLLMKSKIIVKKKK